MVGDDGMFFQLGTLQQIAARVLSEVELKLAGGLVVGTVRPSELKLLENAGAVYSVDPFMQFPKRVQLRLEVLENLAGQTYEEVRGGRSLKR